MNKDDNSNIYNTVKEKLENDLSHDFDKTFWNRFKKENPKKPFSFMSLLKIQIVFPSMAAILIISGLIISYQLNIEKDFRIGNNTPLISMAPILNQVQIEEMELLSEMDSIDLTEEEWEILLGDAT